MSSRQIRNRLKNVGVEVDMKDVQIDILKEENSSLKSQLYSLKSQLDGSKKKEEFLEHELKEAYASLSIERLAARGLNRVETGGIGVGSAVIKVFISIYIFLNRYCRFGAFIMGLLWLFVAFLIGTGISFFYNIFF